MIVVLGILAWVFCGLLTEGISVAWSYIADAVSKKIDEDVRPPDDDAISFCNDSPALVLATGPFLLTAYTPVFLGHLFYFAGKMFDHWMHEMFDPQNARPTPEDEQWIKDVREAYKDL